MSGVRLGQQDGRPPPSFPPSPSSWPLIRDAARARPRACHVPFILKALSIIRGACDSTLNRPVLPYSLYIQYNTHLS